MKVGDAIRHKKHHNLAGVIHHLEPEGVPYYVIWDNDHVAVSLLGYLRMYQHDGSIEPRPAQDDIDVLFP